MPRKRQLPTFSAYTGHAVDHVHIRADLLANRLEIARLLDIDPDVVEARRILPPAAPSQDRSAGAFARMQQIRQHHGAVVVAQVDVAIDEIADLGVRCCAALVHAQHRPSPALVYNALHTLSQMQEIPEDLAERLDPHIREIFADTYPVDRSFFAPGRMQSAHVRMAAERALAQRENPRRGRPAGSASVLTRFMFELVALYNAWSDRPAARAVAWTSTNASQSDTQAVERGRINRFCTRVYDTLPKWAQADLKPPRTTVDRAVKDALSAHRHGRAQPL